MNRTPRLIGLVALAAAVGAGRAAAAGGEPYGTLGLDEVEKMLGAPGVAILDANTDELWAKHHLPGAVHVTGKELARLLPADRGTRLVFYCTNPR